MATLKITQIKSRIGATAKQCANLDALGLHRINHTVTHSDSAIILGMLNRVKHLVTVEVVEEKAPAKKAAKAEVAEAPAVEAPVAEEAPAKKVTKTKKEE
jgi:large subunit ribosomal protein L30